MYLFFFILLFTHLYYYSFCQKLTSITYKIELITHIYIKNKKFQFNGEIMKKILAAVAVILSVLFSAQTKPAHAAGLSNSNDAQQAMNAIDSRQCTRRHS